MVDSSRGFHIGVTMILLSSLVAVISLISLADARSAGAPAAACDTLMPQHSGLSPQINAVPYSINLSPFDDGTGVYKYTPGQIYTLTLSANGGTTFRGFLIQSRLVADDTSRVGEFAFPAGSTGIQLSNCDPPSSGVTHVNGNSPRIEFDSITFVWTAPPAGSGTIRFRFAVVQVFVTFWADQSSDMVAEAAAPEPSSPSVTPTTTEVTQATPTVGQTTTEVIQATSTVSVTTTGVAETPTATPQATTVAVSPTPTGEVTEDPTDSASGLFVSGLSLLISAGTAFLL